MLQHKLSAFTINAQDRVNYNDESRRVFSRRQHYHKIPAVKHKRTSSAIRLNDSHDGSKLESLQRLSNVTATVVNDGSKRSRDSPQIYQANSDDFPNLGRSTWTQNFYDYANAAAGTLGDIMSRENEDTDGPISQPAADLSPALPRSDGLVTTAIPSGSLASRFGIDHPLDRMALTANGNLQRLVSSYYDAPVQVLVDSCDMLSGFENPESFQININRPNAVPKAKRWDRVVYLTVHNQVRTRMPVCLVQFCCALLFSSR